MKFGATNKTDTCRWCGRKLVWVCNTQYEESAAPNGKRRIVSRTRRYQAPGAYGNGHFCGLTCGYQFGLTLATAGHVLVPTKPVDSG
jgi:hypothetical protein